MREFLKQTLEERAFTRTRRAADYQRTRTLLNHLAGEVGYDCESENNLMSKKREGALYCFLVCFAFGVLYIKAPLNCVVESLFTCPRVSEGGEMVNRGSRNDVSGKHLQCS